MTDKRIKVVWVCHFSDEKTRSYIQFSWLYYQWIINIIKKREIKYVSDMSVWITNAIQEFEKYEDIALTIIFPHKGISGGHQQFNINGINYICFKSEDDYLPSRIINKIRGGEDKDYKRNRQLIKAFIDEIKPDIVHVIGAENPYYSYSALDVPKYIPCIVSLQTLMSDPEFIKNYPINKKEYDYRSSLEKRIINNCNYIASSVCHFKDLVHKLINPSAVFLKMTLAVGQNIDTKFDKKEFDFVYFAADLNKAGDYAIEAFALVQKVRPDVTLNMSGSFSARLKKSYDSRIKELGIERNVFFTGSQPTHDAVLKQIKKSRFAVLPLKIDLISGTIREAMACGLPVVTTITPATPTLNEKRECVLLSEKGDYEAMAKNMLCLLEHEEKAESFARNSLLTIREMYSNELFMNKWHNGYYEVLKNFHEGTPFSEDMLL